MRKNILVISVEAERLREALAKVERLDFDEQRVVGDALRRRFAKDECEKLLQRLMKARKARA